VESVKRGDEQVLVLQADGMLLNAHLTETEEKRPLPFLRNGSRLQLTGICLIQEANQIASLVKPASFRILLRSSDDVLVIKNPSFLTLRNTLWLLGLMALIVIAGSAWVIVLRRRVRDQTEIIRQKWEREVVLEERNRIARDLHDTLAQAFAGVAFQLEAVGSNLLNTPAEARKHLGLALTMVRHCLLEARRSVMDLRSVSFEKKDLPAILTETISQLTASLPISVDLEVRGSVRLLPTTIENNLLRLSQEGITNAVQHGKATRLTLNLNYDSESVRLGIADNGCGFDPESMRDGADGHFGLLGMKERVKQMGGEFVLKSCPGEGTNILVTVPANGLDRKAL